MHHSPGVYSNKALQWYKVVSLLREFLRLWQQFQLSSDQISIKPWQTRRDRERQHPEAIVWSETSFPYVKSDRYYPLTRQHEWQDMCINGLCHHAYIRREQRRDDTTESLDWCFSWCADHGLQAVSCTLLQFLDTAKQIDSKKCDTSTGMMNSKKVTELQTQ